jgi:hypothetical protein
MPGDWNDRPDWIPPLYSRRLTSSRMVESPRYACAWHVCVPFFTLAVAILGAVLHDGSMLVIAAVVTVYTAWVAVVYAPRAYRASHRARR